jgi:hypothetical protein
VVSLPYDISAVTPEALIAFILAESPLHRQAKK